MNKQEKELTISEIYIKLCREIRLREESVCFTEEDENLKYENIRYLKIVAESLFRQAKKEAEGKCIPTDKTLLNGAMKWLNHDTRNTTKKVDFKQKQVDKFNYSDKDINSILDEMWGVQK